MTTNSGESESVVMNPSAIGNPNETPHVSVGADLRALLNPCACGGVNGFHGDDCRRSAPFPPVEELCRIAHDAYEKAAVEHGWATQEASRVAWEDVPDANKATMRAAMSAVWNHVGIYGRLVDEVLSIHAKAFRDTASDAVCAECATAWPCRTIAAMRNADASEVSA